MDEYEKCLDKFYTVQEASKVLGFESVERVRQLIHANEKDEKNNVPKVDRKGIKGYLKGKYYLVPKKEVEKYIENKQNIE